MFEDIPSPKWIPLRSWQGKLLARIDIQRGLLEIAHRGDTFWFDLTALRSIPTADIPPSPTGASPPTQKSELEV